MLHSIASLSSRGVDGVDKKKIGMLLERIGSVFVEGEIKRDGLTISSSYKDVTTLSNLNTKSYLQERNQLILDFLTGSIKWNYENQDNSVVLYSLAIVVESIYHLRNMNLILPHCFLTNLVQSFIAGSKTVPVINGKTSPSASYTTYKNWILEKGSKSLSCPSNKDTITFFDNVGKYIIKGYRVSSEKSATADIITATVHFSSQDSILQNDLRLMPKNWRIHADVQKTQRKMKDNIKLSNLNFRKLRMHFIEKGLRKVSTEAKDVENKIAAKAASTRRCTNEQCLKPFDSLKRKCDCGSPIRKVSVEIARVTANNQLLNRSFDFGATEHKYRATITMGEPVLVNPNSYVNVKVLDNMKDFLITGDRKWTFIGSDGPPFCLASRIIEKNPEDYSWVNMLSGLGHLHMNQLKCF
jgi:hypothetical protein